MTLHTLDAETNTHRTVELFVRRPTWREKLTNWWEANVICDEPDWWGAGDISGTAYYDYRTPAERSLDNATVALKCTFALLAVAVVSMIAAVLHYFADLRSFGALALTWLGAGFVTLALAWTIASLNAYWIQQDRVNKEINN